jgi:uncharacterized membrane protein YgaE (UPF0421/DUF939 family)
MISIVCLSPAERHERRMERRRRALSRGLACAIGLVLAYNFGIWAIALVLR